MSVFWEKRSGKYRAQVTLYLGQFDALHEAMLASEEFRASEEWEAAKKRREKWLVGRGKWRERKVHAA